MLVETREAVKARMNSPLAIEPEPPGSNRRFPEENAADPFLLPIEKPKGLMMKLVYAMTRRQFGKVLTPLKVFCARMPLAFGQFYGKISALDKKLQLPPETAMLIREQVSAYQRLPFLHRYRPMVHD
jgi:hypothetical protein